MRLLFVHSDHVEFEATTEAGEGLGETEGVPMEGRMEDCVTAFVTVESADEADLDAVVEDAAAELRDVTGRLNTRKVVLYPYAHLSDDLAGPESAKAVLRDIEAALEGDFEVLRAPFGWYKTREVRCKGHPLSELSRRVTPERPGEDETERATSEWRLLYPDGEARDPREAKDEDRVSDEMRAVVEAETENDAPSTDEASRSELLRERGMADGEPGQRRWYPAGTFVRDALAEYATDLAVEYGAAPVETPDRDPLAAVEEVRERDRPLRLYETGDAGRFGTMHTATGDLDGAREEFRAQVRLAARAGDALGLEHRPVIRVTREFYDADGPWVASLVEDLDAPALLEILPERRGRPSVAVTFAVADGDGPIGVAAVELDADTPSPVVRCSPVDERAVDALVAAAAERATPRLPTWLSPTQVRFLPVGDDHVEHCDALADDLEAAGIRADVDDRDETVGERIAAAESDWVPYFAVVGDREVEGGRSENPLKVTVRGGDAERETTVGELRETVLEEAGDLPKKRRYLPKRVGRRPEFTGR